MSEQRALAARIREYLFELEKVTHRTIALRDKAQNTGDDGYWDGVALNLHGFYSGVERIFEDIIRSIDGNLPAGAEWHRTLLTQVAAEIPGKRPSVITRETRLCLDDYRGFRHIVRNVYTFNFRPSRLNELVDGLSECFTRTQHDLLEFSAFLEDLI